MSNFRVYLNNIISTSVVVEAEDAEAAVELAYDKVPGSVMFLNHTYPDMGDWYLESNDDVEEIN